MTTKHHSHFWTWGSGGGCVGGGGVGSLGGGCWTRTSSAGIVTVGARAATTPNNYIWACCKFWSNTTPRLENCGNDILHGNPELLILLPLKFNKCVHCLTYHLLNLTASHSSGGSMIKRSRTWTKGIDDDNVKYFLLPWRSSIWGCGLLGRMFFFLLNHLIS